MNLSDLFADEDYRFQMALQRGSPAEFFQPTARHVEFVVQREQWLRRELEIYSAFLPPCEPLLGECVALAKEWGTISFEQHQQLAAFPSPRERCIRLGEVWEPDFLLLKADAMGAFQLLGGCVCFPSSWSLAEKIGRPLEFIHTAVPGLNEQLGRRIDAFLAKLTPGTVWLRHNWGLTRSPELNQHPSRLLPRLDETVTLDDVWLRVEHQAFVALPQSSGVLFGIRVAMHPLREVKQNAMATERLTHALRTMPNEVASYKGLATARSQILTLLSDSGERTAGAHD